MAEGETSLAVLIDYENVARPGAKGRADFDIHLVLNRLSDKGRVIVKRAYADWSRYRDARHELQNAGLGLIEMPSAREGAKNRADIQLAVDAMELAYSREHLDNFVIVSGDSDFTPLVGKLRELGMSVTGVGNRDSSSELLIANCDEFIFYDSLSTAGRGKARGPTADPPILLRDTLQALAREGEEWPLASVVKDSMRRKAPAFDHSELGFSTFSKFLEEAAAKGELKLEKDPRSGTYRVGLPDNGAPARPAEAPAESGDGAGRRRRRGRRGGGGGESGESGATPATDEFEVVVTPSGDDDPSADLPPLDQPISYEDMIMLGPSPESGEDNPDLMEATAATATEETPPRRRRRRRGADDAAEASGVEAAEAPAPDAGHEPEADAAPAAEAPSEAKASSRVGKRVPRRGATAAAPAEAAEEEKPKRRTTRRKKADEEPAAAEAAEEEKPKRRTTRRKKADEEPAAAEAAEAAEEAPATA